KPPRCHQIIEAAKGCNCSDACQLPPDLVIGNLGNYHEDAPSDQASEPATALIWNRRTVTSASQSERAGVKKHNLPHDSVEILEQRPMGTQRIDAAHPLLFGRIVWVVGNLFDLVDPTQGRLYVLAMHLLGHHPQLSVRTQARRRNRSNLSVEDCL